VLGLVLLGSIIVAFAVWTTLWEQGRVGPSGRLRDAARRHMDRIDPTALKFIRYMRLAFAAGGVILIAAGALRTLGAY
jgi:hypothetical protein